MAKIRQVIGVLEEVDTSEYSLTVHSGGVEGRNHFKYDSSAIVIGDEEWAGLIGRQITIVVSDDVAISIASSSN